MLRAFFPRQGEVPRERGGKGARASEGFVGLPHSILFRWRDVAFGGPRPHPPTLARRVLPPVGGRISLLALLLALFVLPALAAVGPDEILADPALEARAREIGRSLRCVVCQNQSIDDSSADLAKDMRKIVRERLLAGDSDAQIYAFMTRRYGDFVLLQPPFKPYTLLLWLGPAIALLLAALLLWRLARRRAALLADMTAAAKPLDAEERARLDRLLRDEPR